MITVDENIEEYFCSKCGKHYNPYVVFKILKKILNLSKISNILS